MHNLFKSALKSSNPKDVVGFDYDLSEEQKALFISSVNNLNDLSKFFFMKDRRKFKIFIMMLIVMNISELSTSKVKQVACIITDNEFKIKSSGYNGVPSGFPHLNSNEIDDPSIMELHAEVNALVDCPDSKEELYMFCSLSPCKHCAKAIIASRRRTNISTIYYLNEYESSKPELEGNSSDVKKFLSEAGIELIKFEN
jgi:dCMP deaminase